MKRFCWFFLVVVFLGCSQERKDKDIKEMIAIKAKKEVAFAGVQYMVKDGVVTLRGSCPSQKDKEQVAQDVKTVSGVKGVLNQLTIAPVVLTTDHPLQQAVDSVLKEYPAVAAVVKDSLIQVQGTTKPEQSQKLLSALQQLHAKGLNNRLEIRTAD